MVQRRASRHKGNSDDGRQIGKMLDERAAALWLATTLGDGPLRNALISVAAADSQVVARRPRLEYNETSRSGSVGRVALMEAVIAENPGLLDGKEPPPEIVEIVGGLSMYYMLLEGHAADLPIDPTVP